MKIRHITRAVWILSLVSLFTDVASEMLYPVMPVYLQSIGYSFAFIGWLEGIAEAVAGLSKGFFGRWSDQLGRRLPFVQFGYALSAVSRPLMVLWTQPFGIFTARTADRLGKGIRTAARDALLAQEATPGTRATVFGFHRSMDTLGAVIGPLLAFGYLYLFPGQYFWLFLFAFIPGIISVGLTFLIPEKRLPPSDNSKIPSPFTSITYIAKASPAYKKIVLGLLVFALFNSSDMFLLLRAKQLGVSEAGVILLYVLFNISYVALAWPMGRVADRIGKKKIAIYGFLLFALVYGLMSNFNSPNFLWLPFILYGGYYAYTEGISKAWISDIVKSEELGTAIGSFTALQSIALLIASSAAGLIWQYFGAQVALLLSGIIALLTAFYFMRIKSISPSAS
ncbi:MFS transporter [Thermaurantimonas aggregans]|uniref:MFS transporter n=1 Tax=Thermaurantimonas aggregans TaxID=2173829 RepID=A0A401XKI5_9FLAO|nr:MFS transporter [Thermaurantimonas aggregans]GCD77500.1 MFS transporter [Thermaurantimonas aggregans]